MTDFLTRMAERTLGVAPVAQPIIAPLFAPGPAIPASMPASPESDEMQDAVPPVQKTRTPIARTVPQPPATSRSEESRGVSMQPASGRMGPPMHTQTGQAVFLQQEAQITYSADTRTIPASRIPASPAQHSLPQTNNRSNLMNEPVPIVPIAGTPPSPIEEGGIGSAQGTIPTSPVRATPGQTEASLVPTITSQATRKSDGQPLDTDELQEVGTGSAQGTIPTSPIRATPGQTGASPVPTITSQATPLTEHVHQIFTAAEERDGEKRTAVSSTQSGSIPSRSAHIEDIPLTSAARSASRQALLHEVTEIRELQYPTTDRENAENMTLPAAMPDVGDFNRKTPDTSSSYRAGPNGFAPGRANSGEARTSYTATTEQGLLVSHKPDKADWQDQQAMGLTTSYEEEIIDGASHGEGQAAAPTARGQLTARSEKQDSRGVSEPSAMIPTIRVTIGRIDVRAVTSSETATRAKPTRAAPRISLEDYARQNKQGGR